MDKRNTLVARHRTGDRILYKNTGKELVEWKCPVCCHRWWEYSDADEYPEVCPLCGSYFAEEQP